MATIEEKITYGNYICTFVKSIGKLSFYTYEDKDKNEHLLVVDNNKNVLARINACMGCGAYGDYFNGFVVNSE